MSVDLKLFEVQGLKPAQVKLDLCEDKGEPHVIITTTYRVTAKYYETFFGNTVKPKKTEVFDVSVYDKPCSEWPIQQIFKR